MEDSLDEEQEVEVTTLSPSPRGRTRGGENNFSRVPVVLPKPVSFPTISKCHSGQ